MADRPLLPTDFGPDLLAWWDASDESTISKWPTAVSDWRAKGSAGLVATLPENTNPPTFQASSRNGKPGLFFENGSELRFNAAALALSDLTVAVSAQLDASVPWFYTMRAFSFGDWAGDNTIQIIRNGSGRIMETASGSIAANDDWSGLDRLVLFSKNGTAGTLYDDGVQVASGGLASQIAGSNGFIGRGTDYADNWMGVFQQILVFGRVLTTTERQQLEGWESWYTGKNGANLPSGHPYKYARPMIAANDNAAARRRRLILLSA